MAAHLISLVFIMLVVGAAGGVINYYRAWLEANDRKRLVVALHMLGVLMTFLAPFILSIFGSTLIVDSEGNPAVCLAKPAPPLTFVDMLQHQLQQL